MRRSPRVSGRRRRDTPEPIEPAGSPPSLVEIDGRTALLIDGAVQSVTVLENGDEPSGYWPALVPERRPARTLILGFGGGTVARLLHGRFAASGPLEIVGVDDDLRVIALAGEAFGNDLPGLLIVRAGAEPYLRQSRDRGARFDLVVVDLFRAGRVPDGVCGGRFLGLIADALAPDGMLAINLDRGQGHAHQLRRLSHRFQLDRIVAVGLNLVVHAHRRPGKRYARR